MTTEKLKLEILYEDNHLIAVFKPAGVLVQGNRPVGERNEPTLMDEVKEYLKEKYKKPGNVFLGLVHRLDRPVSGIILFAKTSKGAARISEQIREREMRKIYHAVVDGQMKSPSGTLRNFLKKDEEKRIAKIVKEREGDLAELDYETVKTNGKISLLKIELKTGRFHQIRVQLSAIGHPIVGDKKYGSKEQLSNGSIALCATELTFETATTGETKKIGIDWPEGWREFLSR
ncbi:MAG: hypothetical protein A2736_00625 [Candidatus Yanofskybacteria bacterium RIFCSPHIGHO2_01_FULL_41_27]|uniref:Pseudouridine synthase n=2 Tax=Candidatus Yanofskyibacteriota TaxID=1752733 RepID=A0A0G1AIB3_9BACT|nr:MAG: pseudouridine synthase [Candidatus Yanofskybacteria bacterium GW2011_GWC2_41_9]OGM99559.1 MAG: hypothetical protein A2736_00625 [Candidatus Yanofskybacteria bacterium RIFCSPHIGHO2_01_FULL_41_27]OGN09495.1 MAG: hypothetical protein A3C64_01330 [Candidatus Yanofskybacteria bacterium RIFCSPHIGHO2_02_FULL_41_12]OGN20894.1 MAG: hypothetical protein A3B00_00795 [Candidatus Yanofskybacteria bacterium RIFCSPLOWO2_01_FULL_41_33]